MSKLPEKSRKMWPNSPAKRPKAKVPDDVKAAVTAQAEELLVEWRHEHIKPPAPEYQFNYIVELYGKWFGISFYFCAKYACPSPDALSPFFEMRFTRIEYIGERRFSLAYMGHTGKWVEVEQDLTIYECFKALRDGPWYAPL